MDTETGLVQVAGAGHPALRILAVTLCAAGALAAAVAYRSERRLDEIRQLSLTTATGNDPAARERARRQALDLVPSAKLLNPDNTVDVQVALFLDPRRGDALLHKLIRREPEDIFLWLALTRKKEREGNLAAARRAYLEARALDPRLRAPR